MNKKIIYISVFFIIFSCTTVNKLNYQNFADLYQPDISIPLPEYVVFHKSESFSTFYFKINSLDMLYSKDTEKDNNYFYAKSSIRYRLYDLPETKLILDSGTVFISDSIIEDNTNKSIIDSIDFKAGFPGNYLLIVTFRDLKRNTSNDIFIKINKSDSHNRQNFIVRTQDGLPLFRPYISGTERIKVFYKGDMTKQLYVKFYKEKYPIAKPTFEVENARQIGSNPDSIFNENQGNLFVLPEEGIYHFQTDTATGDGITVFRFYEGFPDITTPEQMIYPLRYITTKSEYEKVAGQGNKKIAVDNFWLEIAGNPERARGKIKLFYNRVQFANKMFTSYIEGWKTDRGVTYIIYGSPNVVYRSSNSETWIYGEVGNIMSLTLNFYYHNNPFTENDYVLEKSLTYKDSWYNSVDVWRR